MTKTKVMKLLIEKVALTEPGQNLPSINTLSQEFSCSRGILQNTLINLESNNAVVLTKHKRGTVLQSKNTTRLIELYYEDNLTISIPKYSLQTSTSHSLTYDILTSDLFYINPKFSYNDSSLERIDDLLNNKSDLALISEDYYEQLNNPDLLILHEYQNLDKQSTTLQASDNPNLAYKIDELPTNNNTNSYTTNNYYLVANNITYNLLKNKA